MTAGIIRGVPIALVWLGGRPVVTLRDVPAESIHQPFWDDTLAHATGVPRLLPLDRAPDPPDGWRPAGSIFHMQRCGSTLACRLLGAIPRVRALSEPMIFQSLLVGPGSAADRRIWLRRLLGLHAAALCPGHEALVIKWSSMNVYFEPEITAACNGTPSVFMWRDPIEVLVSGLDGVPRNIRVVPPWFFAPHLGPATRTDVATWSTAELLARFQGSCCHHAARSVSMRLVDYRSLPAAVWDRLTSHFGLPEPAPAVVHDLAARAAIDAKDPDQRRVFLPDSDRKQSKASDSLRTLAARFVEPALQALRARHSDL